MLSYWYILPIVWLMFPDSLFSYWYILSDLSIPLVAYLATWYLLNNKTSIVVMQFHITNVIFETHHTDQPSDLTRETFYT